MCEIVSHTELTAHSPPFSLVGGTTYQILLTGTIADGSDSPELQRLVNGSFVSLDPPAIQERRCGRHETDESASDGATVSLDRPGLEAFRQHAHRGRRLGAAT
jgi:hypothetical protein